MRYTNIYIDNEYAGCFVTSIENWMTTTASDRLKLLYSHDGFDSSMQFVRWFNEDIEHAQIIHWADMKY